MRRVLTHALLPAAALAAAGSLAVPAFAGTATVKVGDNFFVRASGVPTVTVNKGDRVVWRWVGDAQHNVVVTKGPQTFRSSIKTSGTYARTMSRSGTYTIICTVHGASDQSMKLRVR